MKRYNNLYEQITTHFILDTYYKQVKRNTKNKASIKNFDDYFTMNIADIKEIFDKQKYVPNKYNIFLITSPKYRIVMSQKIKDKLINHIMGRLLIKALEPSLINNNVATRKNKGTHYGMKCLKKYLNELKGTKVYALKFDVSKYFYSIDHEILKKLLRKKIKDKRFLTFMDIIIDSTDEKVNDEIKNVKARQIKRIQESNMSNKSKVIFEIKNIPLYEKGKGIPIGNLTSQIMAIYYLNDLDHYIKNVLKVKYIRYMDDGVLLSNDKEYLKYCLTVIKKIIEDHKLKLNSKTKIFDVNKEGIDFLGFRFLIKNNKIIMKVRNNTKKRFKRKLKLIKSGKIDMEQGLKSLNSYHAHLKWGNCYALFHKNINRYFHFRN